MTFEQWCHSIGIEETRICSSDMVSMEILKECWDFKQVEVESYKGLLKINFSEIQRLESELEEKK